jgi:3-dehydroquinate synthetase
VADTAVEELGVLAAGALEGRGLRAALIARPGGEAGKTLGEAGVLWERFLEAGLGRDDLVVAVGGGATLDAAGFAAATYMRGVALVNVPTTLLAMADAALGGKVAVDHAGVKNLAGAFHQPRAVLVDPDALASLPARDRTGGLAEVVKSGVLAAPAVLDLLAGADDAWAVEQAVRVKAAYVGADPLDRGLRRSLNLGHTFAHAIEAATGYAVPHGEAVAIGLAAAARLGASLGITDPALDARIRRTLEELGLPREPPEELDPARVTEAMRGDKKRRGAEVPFVVPTGGGAEVVEGVPPEQAISALLPERAARS